MRRRIGAVLLALALGSGCTRAIKESDLFHPRASAWTTDRIQRRNVVLPLPGGTALRGWHLVQPDAKATLLFFYGNGETVSTAAARLWRWAEAFQCNILCMDYRGYGFSDGTPSLAALREDALRVFDATAALREGRPTLIASFSIGTVPAVHVASQRPVSGLLLLAPVSTLEDVLPAWQKQVPWAVRPFLRLKADPKLVLRPAPLDEIHSVRVPMLVLHGDADRVIPLECSRKLLAQAGAASKDLLVLPGADHNDLSPLAPTLRPRVEAWLDSLLKPQP